MCRGGPAVCGVVGCALGGHRRPSSLPCHEERGLAGPIQSRVAGALSTPDIPDSRPSCGGPSDNLDSFVRSPAFRVGPFLRWGGGSLMQLGGVAGLGRGLLWTQPPPPPDPPPLASLQAGAHAALHALQAPLCPCVCRLLRLFWPDRLRRDQR